MTRVGEKKRSAAAAQRGEGSEGEDPDEATKRRGIARTPLSSNRDLINVPVPVGNKAPAPQKAIAANASVVAPPREAEMARPIGIYGNFELEMQAIEKGKPSKTAAPVEGSPVKFGSPGRTKSSKVWVAGLKSGEMVAYVTDRYHPELPAFIKLGLSKFRDDPELCQKAMVSELLYKKADQQPFKTWAVAKVSVSTQKAYTLYWYVLVRKFKDLADHTPEARIAWGGSLANYFERTDPPNKFEYGGDLSKDQARPASDFFKVQDVMEKFIKKRLAGYMSESEIVQNSHLMASYYGDDPVLNSQVTQFYMPEEQQPDEAVGQEEANLNKELFGLF
jgi:hypothetical protein